jgi:hypothetical protein
MPDPRELMALLQGGGGGGGAPIPSGMSMPTGGGGAMAQALQQKLAQLMQDPVARAGMQAHMQGQDPRAAAARVGIPSGPMPNITGRGPSTDQELYDSSTANQDIRGNLPIEYKGPDYTGFSEEVEPMPDPRQTPMPSRFPPPGASPNRGEMGPTDRVQPDGRGAQLYDMIARGRTPEGDIPPGKEQDMISREIDRKGATFDGVDAPTQNDIERLRAEPTDTMVEAFDDQFGDGAAADYMNEKKSERVGGPYRPDETDDPNYDDYPKADEK